ncbi:MAG TPA: hypothetical protein DCQ20_02075, partial [Nitrospira sp.]|nr:hypothetical protein [Nitrospira sp.]
MASPNASLAAKCAPLFENVQASEDGAFAYSELKGKIGHTFERHAARVVVRLSAKNEPDGHGPSPALLIADQPFRYHREQLAFGKLNRLVNLIGAVGGYACICTGTGA